MANENYENNVVSQNAQTEKTSKAKKKSPLPLIAGCLAIIAVILAAFVIMPDLSSDEKGNEEPQTVWVVTKYSSEINKYGSHSKLERVYEYDDKGNLIRENVYTANGELSSYYIYDYDDNNNLIKETYYKATGEEQGHTSYKYDSNGNMIEEAEDMFGTGSPLVYKYEYDAAGNCIKEFYGDNINTSYEYDNNGNLLKEFVFINGEKYLSLSYEYDSKGNLTYLTRYRNSGTEIANRTGFEYDSSGNCIKRTQLESYYVIDGTYVYEYDSNGNRIREKQYFGERQNLDIVYTYDENGNLLSKEVSNLSSGNTYNYYYEYMAIEVTPSQAEKIDETRPDAKAPADTEYK